MEGYLNVFIGGEEIALGEREAIKQYRQESKAWKRQEEWRFAAHTVRRLAWRRQEGGTLGPE